MEEDSTEHDGVVRLYARDALLHALVPRLTGLAYDKRALVAQEHREDLPVVLVTGRHGMGRTAVLDSLERAYRGRLPLGRVDFAQADRGLWAGGAVSNTSPVAEVLEQLVCELASPSAGTGGRIRFPRLLPGLFAVSSWHRGNEHEQRLAHDRIVRLLVACGLGKDDGTDTGGDLGADWMSDVSESLPDTSQQHDLDLVAAAVVGQYFTRHTRSRAARPVQHWYHERAEGTANGQAALVRLCLRFHQGGDFRYAVERMLLAAFISDVADAYGTWKKVNRAPRPLLLLDNVHTTVGRSVLDLLLEHRAGRESDTTDPLVVVATRLGDGEGLYPDASHSELPELVTASGWARTVPGSPSAGLLAVPLAPLSIDDLLMMLDAATGPLHRHLPSALYAVTSGHPQSSRLLCEAIVHTNGRRPVRPEELLDLHTGEGHPVTERILEQLIPPDQLRDHLVQLSLARDRDAAEALAAGGAVRGPGPYPAAVAAQYLEEEYWTEREHGDAGRARWFVTDPLLRTLLVHEARRNAAQAGTGRSWSDLHCILRGHHTAPGSEGIDTESPDRADPDALRHTLAAGDADLVVTRLTAEFGSREAVRWLDTLRYVTTAPHPPSAEWPDHRTEIARGAHDRQYSEADDVRRSVNRLLHALWYLSHPLAEPHDDLCDGIGAELMFLSMRHTTGRAVLNQASRAWPTAARVKQPFPIDEPS